MLAAVILSGSLVAALPADSEDLTVADVVKGLALDESKLSYSDEPPGKLRGLECRTTLRDTKVKVLVRIEVVYTTALFSDRRKWDIKAVRAAKVRKVSIEPEPADK
jgi:hypothetical protein